jgi:bifunctional DNA-binding transcriptional regulator/antitoxin component of YhaV-PrlF toxin-antitoxin module
MSATVIREKGQTTLPAEMSEAAKLRAGDQVDWRFEGGEIRGRKLASRSSVLKPTKEQVLKAIETSPLGFTTSWDQLKAETR